MKTPKLDFPRAHNCDLDIGYRFTRACIVYQPNVSNETVTLLFTVMMDRGASVGLRSHDYVSAIRE